ncbi:HAD-IIIC family phosphatase [Paenibacillus barcinonensis]|uniref:HAD superfamily phosphatase (TIGR01681 family)/FkbH-like protein n=1 Tax=Paenibacillus barcinonensis TaxID=198119 RepID=A0A2V4W8P9_PAEBA|nr:HAD-IIIC family phosphatase [Paenibacillus barcinonensis]PYE47525.1 HAD superfamily phosphatase (TIGR01681 family)/FkbH-like protein [Paenibacillus barcinonensis]QKS56435.1 HAD-IIIC family phosphatase [Paenibacillus barcinonensis]
MERTKDIKCVIWDLDHTIWNGVLLESGDVQLRPHIKEVIEQLDSRGILHSVASKNDAELAWAKLTELGMAQYFLYPEIHWDAKSTSIQRIQQNLNIGIDALLFVDDQPFELEEVKSVHADIHVLHADHYETMLDDPRLMPRFITADSARRRQMYQADTLRKQAEEQYEGPSEQFLASLGMKFTIYEATEDDLQRAEELTVRTNQLNATGITYSYEELHQLMNSQDYLLLVCELEDKYGTYGKIGLALVHKQPNIWRLNMLLMSCRVMSRGAGSVLLTYIMREAQQQGKQMLADFRDTGRNRMMNISYRFAGFTQQSEDSDGKIVFSHDLKQVVEFPDYIEVCVPERLHQ